MADAACRHVVSALARLADARLVAITGANFGPEAPAWRDAFACLQEQSRVMFTAAIDGAVCAKHGTTIETRLTVIDKMPASDAAQFPPSAGVAPDMPTLLDWIAEHIPPRCPITTTLRTAPVGNSAPRTVRGYIARSRALLRGSRLLRSQSPMASSLPTRPWTGHHPRQTSHGCAFRRIRPSVDPYSRLSGASNEAVQSAAMASVAPPKPSYRPHLPATLITD
jgi:hypothetical protein